MADSCDFGKFLNTRCDKLLYARQTGRKNIKELDHNLQCICFGDPDHWRRKIMCSRFVSIMNSCLGRYLRERLIKVAAF